MEGTEGHLCLFIEILSGSNLVIRDRKAKSSDPYIKVKLANKDIHQTRVVSKNLNPTYGDAQNNSFILDCEAKDLFDQKGLLFKIKDYNKLRADEDMGTVLVPAMEIYKASGMPMEFDVTPPPDLAGQNAGKVTIRCWPATEAHLKKFGKKGLSKFVSGFQSNIQKLENSAKDFKHDFSERVSDMTGKANANSPFKKKEETKEKEDPKPTPVPQETPTEPALKEEPKTETVVEKSKPVGSGVMKKLKIVVEVIAAKNILIGDVVSSDPYVKVMLGEKEVHKTKHLNKTLNPIFSPELHSTFLLEATDAELSDRDGVLLVVKDWDMLGGNEDLGTVQVPYLTLTQGNGEPLEFPITPPKEKSKEAGHLLVRCREATPEDEKILSNKKNKTNVFSTTTKEAVESTWKPSETKAEEEAEPAPATKSEEPPATRVIATTEEEGVKPKPGEELHLKVEIVSARGLIAADKNGLSDPYVKLLLGEKELHKTKHINKTLNPSFEDMDNIFALHCPADELFKAGGLTFKVRDWDRIGKNDELGLVLVPAGKIYANMHGGDNIEAKISPPKGKEKEEAGYLTLRITTTSAEDHAGEKKKFLGMTAPQIHVPKVTEMFHKDRAIEFDENEEPQPMFIQVVSCRDLLVADKTGSSDPYVKIKLGKKDLHETKHISQTLNPVYTSEHNSYFILEARPSEVRAHGGLVFKVKDWDRVGKNDDLGVYTMDADTLYKCEGNNMEVKLKAPKGIGEDAGFLTIRCRPATEADMATRKSLFSGLGQKISLKDYGKIDLHLLIEVVSAWQIPIADLNSSDPYVKVKIGPRDVHQTKPISNTREPIYTIKHNSVFILDVATKEITENGGISFKIKDYDMIGANDDLGEVTVPPETILEAKGERLELQLKDGENDAGWLALRIRPATEYDRSFLKGIKEKNAKVDFMGLRESYNKTMKPAGGSGARIKTLMKKMTKEEGGVKKFRVRPYPDPEREKETEFMSEQEINQEALKPSRKWLDIGSGKLGKIFVEIIGADGLPNKDHDMGGLSDNKTDSFVSIVFEDAIAKTDIIDDCLSPRWMPWMQRAFIFRMLHTSSNINLAVFDYDPGFASDHDICGKVSIDLANLLPNTEYLLRYNLYENSVMPDREAKGIIMVRLRMELKSEKERILSNLSMPPEFYVNVKDGKDFDMVRQTVGGRQDMQAYSKDTIKLYVDELMGYQVLKYYLIDAAIALVFWRGQVKVYGYWLPLHSVALFLSAITLAEKPSLYPSFWFFSLGWLLLSLQTYRNNTWNPWYKTKTFLGLTQEFLTGTCFDGPSSKIAPHEKEEEAKEEERRQNERIEKARKRAEDYMKAQNEMLAEHESMMAQVGDQSADTDISSKKGNVSIDPLKFILYPIQQYLAMACHAVRVVKSVLLWDEPYISYIITVAAFAIGTVFLIVPWAFIIRWTSRLVSWLLLGPHMKLVDVYWYSKIEELSEEEQKEQIREALTTQLKTAQAYAAHARLQRENAAKLRDIKKALYGQFVTRIPVIAAQRFGDIPLHSSTATPYKASADLPRTIPARVPGQHLVGDMVPKIMSIEDDDEISSGKGEEAKKND